MANPDYYDLRKLRTLVDPALRNVKINPNTAYFNNPKFTPSTDKPKKENKRRPKKQVN